MSDQAPRWFFVSTIVMSLKTGQIFRQALCSNHDLMSLLAAHDVYATGILLPDDGLDNVPIPYIIVMVLGGQNDQTTKDDYESEYDSRHIGIEIAARNTDDVADIAEMARKTIHDYFVNMAEDEEGFELLPEDYQYSDDGISLDTMKPCCLTTLHYQCDVKNSNYRQDGQEE